MAAIISNLNAMKANYQATLRWIAQNDLWDSHEAQIQKIERNIAEIDAQLASLI